MKRRRADLAHLKAGSREYKTEWQRKNRGSVSWADYKAKVQARAANKKPCTIEGCGKKRCSKDYCATHYWRWKRHGDPMVVLKPRALVGDVVGKMTTRAYFTDMPKARIIVSREILRSLGR